MYTQTRSKSISEATDKLYNAKSCDLVFGCTTEQLTDAQREALYEVLDSYGYAVYVEDRKLALENLYVNLTDDHIYILEMADDGDDNIEYYYTEIVPNTTIYKDANGNLWYCVDYDTNDKLYEVTVVDEDNGHYTNTNITWYMTEEELNECTTLEVEV